MEVESFLVVLVLAVDDGKAFEPLKNQLQAVSKSTILGAPPLACHGFDLHFRRQQNQERVVIGSR